MVRSLALAVPLLLLSAAALADTASQHRIRLTYRGASGPHAHVNGSCPGADPANSRDVLEGTVRGVETNLATAEVISYSGTLERKTKLDICDLRPAPDIEWDYCVTHLAGHGTMRATIEVQTDRPTAYVTLEWRKGTAKVDSIGGNCEADLIDEIRANYLVDGEGAEFELKKTGPLRDGETYIQPSRGTGDPGGPWTLEVLDQAGIEARPGGPYSFERAATITLDGSRSTPSTGHRIDSYEWKLTPTGAPEGCAGIGRQTTMTGATVTFVALCSLTAELTVRDDGGEEDAGSADVTVRVRPWTSKLTTDPAVRKEKSFTFVANGRVFGYNRCSRAGHFDEEENHWYEARTGSVNDYETGSFWLDEVTDDGPFAGVQYVSKGEFEMPRATWVNSRFYPGGDVHDLNPGATRPVQSCPLPSGTCPFGEPVLARLRASVEAHELMHSTLAKRALAGTKDPAPEVERLLGSDRSQLADVANRLIGAATSAISNASTEDDVKAELMRAYPNLVPGGCIDFPDWDGAVRGCYFRFQSFVDR